MAEYDFIVVGTGSAGSVVASRLTESAGVSVLALEAGGSDYPATTSDPTRWFTLFGSEIDWAYNSVPQPGLDGRSTYEPRGKAPGGSSNLYIMMHIRGHRADYDNWAYNGCPGWTYDDCLPWFQKLEDQDDDTNPTAGKGGPIPVNNARLHDPNPASAAFIEGCVELGYPRTEDFNGPHMEGAGWHHVNIRDGKRFSTKQGYLDPALARPNLTLSTGSQVTGLVFSDDRCIGVQYVKDGRSETATARHDVVVSAGAIESPKLLLLSGIGPAAHLSDAGIEVRVGLSGVGENFHNHVLTGVIAECSQPMPAPHLNQSEAALFCSSSPGWVGPDLQIGFVTVPFDIIVGQQHPNSVSILPGIVRPMSRGWVRLAGSDPMARPLINPNYLAAEADRRRLVDGVRLAREIFATSALSKWVGTEVSPGPDVTSQEAIEAFVVAKADSYHHQAGSCKMGSDAMSVVDPVDLRVYGVEGLRVADASVMPTVPSGNCHAGIVMIAERLAGMLKLEYGL